MDFVEDKRESAAYREEYLAGVKRVVEDRRREADEKRAAFFTPEALARDPESFRRAYVNLLGWPMTEAREGLPRAWEEGVKPYGRGTMRRLRVEVLLGLPLTGILLLPPEKGPHPLVIAQHGGGGTPELVCDLHGDNNYRHVAARLLERGCAVFAPQLLLWSGAKEDAEKHPGYGLDNERGQMDAALRHLGGGIASLEIFALMRALDYLLAREDIDGARVGMTGLSYGGFYTHVTAAADTRIRAACTNAFFNDRYAYCWADAAWPGAALQMRDAEICALIAPRALCVHVGRGDAVFDYRPAEREMQKLPAFYAAQGAADKLKLIVSDVNHAFTDTGEELDFMLANMG